MLYFACFFLSTAAHTDRDCAATGRSSSGNSRNLSIILTMALNLGLSARSRCQQSNISSYSVSGQSYSDHIVTIIIIIIIINNSASYPQRDGAELGSVGSFPLPTVQHQLVQRLRAVLQRPHIQLISKFLKVAQVAQLLQGSLAGCCQ